MPDCPAYRPDHNGECLDCDEWADAHTPEALAAGQALAKDHPHAKLAQDCWGLIRGLRDPDDPEYDAAAIHLIEMACDCALISVSRAPTLPVYCVFCGAYLRGGATIHASDCAILRINREVLGEG